MPACNLEAQVDRLVHILSYGRMSSALSTSKFSQNALCWNWFIIPCVNPSPGCTDELIEPDILTKPNQQKTKERRPRRLCHRYSQASLRIKGRSRASRTGGHPFIRSLLCNSTCAVYHQYSIPTNCSSVALATGANLFGLRNGNFTYKGAAHLRNWPLSYPHFQIRYLVVAIAHFDWFDFVIISFR